MYGIEVQLTLIDDCECECCNKMIPVGSIVYYQDELGISWMACCSSELQDCINEH